MNRTAAFLALLLIFVAGACAGARARENVLIPSMAVAWPGIEADARVGVEALGAANVPAGALQALDAMAPALESKDPVQVLSVNWPMVEPLALTGIAERLRRKEVGPNGAESLRNRVLQFSDAFRQLASPPPVF